MFLMERFVFNVKFPTVQSVAGESKRIVSEPDPILFFLFLISAINRS